MDVLAKSDRLNYVASCPADLVRPLDFLVAEHERYHTCCEMLCQLADNPTADFAPRLAATIVRYVTEVLPLHVVDEEEGLYPLLRRDCYPEDNIAWVLEKLSGEHGDDAEVRRSLIEPLMRIAEGMSGDERFSRCARSFAIGQRRHLGLENVFVLPLAYMRLSEEAQAELWHGMAVRRGLLRPN